jgi:predicted flap endonuclease-1-like 5' DNA nuclease
MLYVGEVFWPWLLAALIMGSIIGWQTWSNKKRRSWFAGWAKWGAAAFGIGLVAALLRILPGRWGLWLETAILSFIAYIFGCFVGGWLQLILKTEKTAVRRKTSIPPPAPRLPGEDKHKGSRPPGFAHARGRTPDDLKLIRGIGHQNEGRLHGLGVWHFDQIAAWTPDNINWVGSYLAFRGRIRREKWVKQAKELAAGVTTKFAKRVEDGLVKTKVDDGSRGQRNIEKVR